MSDDVAPRPSHLDLCSGVGGFALAAEWAGYQTIGFCEIEPWPRKVLAKNFPKVPQHDDLKTLTGSIVRGWLRSDRTPALDDAASRGRGIWPDGQNVGPAVRNGDQTSGSSAGNRDRLDLITGGYPCQPFSLAGKRLGAEDDRHLWPFIATLVADLKPERCLFENVYGHVSMGLDAVLADLEALGYACGAVVVPAAAVGAPHRRDRVWILADADIRGIEGDWSSGARGNLESHERRDITANPSTAEKRGRRFPNAETLLGGTFERRQPDGTLSGDGAVSDPTPRGIRRGRPSGDERQSALVREIQPDASDTEIRQRTAVSVGVSPSTCDSGQALSGVGDAPDGLSGWVARCLNPWAGDWEDGCPRTQATEADRPAKLKALGNAIVPQVAYAILSAWGLPE